MIRLAEVRFSYRTKERPVLDALSVDLPAGALTAVTGSSGCGKSTMLYVLGLMLRPQEGAVWFGDSPVSALPDGERSRLRGTRIGFVFQDAALDATRSVIDNVLEGALFSDVPARHAVHRARVLLEEFGVAQRFDHRPGEISGGQAQRVALCRALVKSPDIILADEPSGNLDEASADVVWSALRGRAQAGAAVIVATHDPVRAGQADKVVTL